MKTDLYSTLRMIATIQAERRKNWNGGDAPADAKLESKHQAKLQQLRAKLS